MGDEANSWLRRTNFSHTVCHRLDSSALGSVPFTLEDARLRLRPFAVEKQGPACGRGRQDLVVRKQRSLSPLPDTALSDTFREARTERKRFSTPLPQRKDPNKGAKGRSLHKDSRQRSLQSSTSSSSSLGANMVRSSSSVKAVDKVKGRKDGWTKYFDHGSGRVVAVDSADHWEWEVDMSKLFLGLRFAHGAHSRLYHGIYKDEPVAVKIIRVPDDDDGSKTLASRLENQFTREVTLLSHLHHRHVIKVVVSYSDG
ncbi:hypothetical protein MLD38_015164 [Melastoma candidum]|uniref:Uncharacterized protein n=1 Tax=Melastoma candidum TaxID=119954 RepID=A0ACB9RGD3_9MYRT|nr:hypothetical protein MLD38_015164 [Melastoma candidum]